MSNVCFSGKRVKKIRNFLAIGEKILTSCGRLAMLPQDIGKVHALCGGGLATDGLYFAGITWCGVEKHSKVYLAPTGR